MTTVSRVTNTQDELGTEELGKLQKAAVREMSSEEETGREGDVPTSFIGEICAKWGEVQSFVERCHPDTAVASFSMNVCDDNAKSRFRNILKRRKKNKSHRATF
jgi:hypothetical protein